MKLKEICAIGLASYLGGIALLGGIGDAVASFRRVHSSQCHHFFDDAGTDLYNGVYLSSAQVTHGVYCPVPSDSELPHSSTVTLNIHGYSPSPTSASSQTLAKAYNTNSITVGTLKYWGSGNSGVFNVDVSPWSDGAAFPMIYNVLPGGSMLYGFYMST